MLDRILPAKLRSYPQFVQDGPKQMKSSCNMALKHLQAQHLQNKQFYDKDNTAVQFCIGDRIWLYAPVVSRVRPKSLLHFGKVLTLLWEVEHKIQLIGGT